MITGFGTTVSSDQIDTADRFDLRLSPNPVSEALAIEYQLGTSARVQVSVFTPDGRLLSNIIDTTQTPGIHQLRYDLPGQLPAGQYRCLLKVNDKVASKAFVLQQ